MSPSCCEGSSVQKRKVRAEAAAWLARLHGPNRTPALEKGLRRWLAEDSLHAREFELATDVWNETGGHPGGLPRPHQGARLARVFIPALAATAAALLLGSWWLVQALGPTSLSTGIGDQKTVMLGDGSRITLNTDTQLSVQYGNAMRIVTLKYGEAYFDVVHNPTRPFIVRAGERKVIDLGTRFVVNRTGSASDPLTVTVIEGRVAVAPADTPDISPPQLNAHVHIVSAGHLFGFHPDAVPTIRNISVDEATAWLNGQLIFDGTSLVDAAEQLNRYNAMKIRVMSSQAATIPVGGVFRIGDSLSFARAVAAANHLRLITEQHELVLAPYASVPSHQSSASPSKPGGVRP